MILLGFPALLPAAGSAERAAVEHLAATLNEPRGAPASALFLVRRIPLFLIAQKEAADWPVAALELLPECGLPVR